ncbi:response regulator [Sulfurimonas sp. MAG313]|nr:response regulator [Sulfurimonas sp. MAG313]MDF1881119.1 response regulator [Sulfurimonas sp. MAG313]
MANPMVMFIDDSETALASTRMTVTSMPIEVKQYLEAQLCLADVKAGIVPDLIITDLNMPVMNGLELLKELRSLPATARTPVLMLTTETKDELKVQGKALGLTGWIVKPFNPTQLKSAITRVLRLPA